MRHSSAVIFYIVQKQHIDQEVVEKLDAIVEIAARAKPMGM